MTEEHFIDSIITFLRNKNYSYIKPLGEGGFASVIAVRTPNENVAAVKIIKMKDTWILEDKLWPCLSHRNILPVLDVMTMENPAVKLYVMPMIPKALDETLLSATFQMDPNGFVRIKLWIYDILLALKYLHSLGLCHCDIKSDNILIDEEERALLADFSGLNYSNDPQKRLCSPLTFRPPEYFIAVAERNIQGVPYDLYTFGLMALNMLTGHWPQIQLGKIDGGNWSWSTDVWPILEKNLKIQNFEYLIRRSLPYADISEKDVLDALDFIQSLLKIKPDERPTAPDMLKHPFLKMGRNPFRNVECNHRKPLVGDNLMTNPFRKMNDMKLSGSQGDTAKQNPHPVHELSEIKFCTFEFKVESYEAKNLNSQLPLERAILEDDSVKYGSRFCLLQSDSINGIKMKKKIPTVKKNIKERVTGWIWKKFKKSSRKTYKLF